MSSFRMFLAFTMPLLGVALLAGDAGAQQKTLKEQLIGTWMAISVVTAHPDGRKISSFGPDVKGMQIFDTNGRVVIILGLNGFAVGGARGRRPWV